MNGELGMSACGNSSLPVHFLAENPQLQGHDAPGVFRLIAFHSYNNQIHQIVHLP